MSLHGVVIAAPEPEPAQGEANRFLASLRSGINAVAHPLLAVIPPKAGNQFFGQHVQSWIPAFAGTTAETGPVPPVEPASNHRAFAARSETPHVAR
jgi:hypothetical protein